MTTEHRLGTEIGRFSATVRFEDLTPDVIEKLKICLYFNLGIGIAGAVVVRDAVQAASRFPMTTGPSARVFVSGTRLAPPDAAFGNALMMHARAQDDFQHSANCHVGAIATPAVLALSDWRDFDGRRFLTSLAVAYQVSTVLGDGFTALTTPRGFRASGLYATCGTAAACAHLLGLDAVRAANAVCLSASFASGLGQPWVSGTDEWRLQLGHASRNGVNCALLAEDGNNAAPDAFEGKYGFYAAHAATLPDVPALIDRLRGPWLTETVAFKPLPVCGINQGPARHAMDLARRRVVDSDQITSIEIQLPEEDVAYPGIAATGPIRSPGAALMRSAFVVSNCLVTGQLRYRDLLHRDHPAVLSLADKCRVVVGHGLTPMSHAFNITTRDGTVHEFQYQATGKEFILSRSEIRDVFAQISDELALPMTHIDKLEEVIWRLDGKARANELIDALIPEHLTGQGPRA